MYSYHLSKGYWEKSIWQDISIVTLGLKKLFLINNIAGDSLRVILDPFVFCDSQASHLAEDLVVCVFLKMFSGYLDDDVDGGDDFKYS